MKAAKKSRKTAEKHTDASRARRVLQRLGRFVLTFALWFVGLSLGLVVLLKFVPPPGTWLMVGQWFALEGESPRWDYRFRKGEDLGTHLGLAVIAAEDQRFGLHHGFDLEAIGKAMEHNEKGGKIRGASTISQQTAKNVFLWPSRSWVRKGLEVWFTVLIELIWGKERILEVYQNIAEFGPGIYGAEAAAQHFFGKSAAQLSRSEAALLAAVLPSPRRYSAARPSAYVQRRQRWILRQMNNLHSVEAVLHPDPEVQPAKSKRKRSSEKD